MQVWEEDREYLEKCYTNFLRNRYPRLDEFRKFVHESFSEEDYVIRDETQHWPRDIRVCVMNNLGFKDIIRLASTSKKWRQITTSRSYDEYWKKRYRQDFFSYPPSYILPASDFVVTKMVNVSKKRKKVNQIISVLWFDAYQFVTLKTSRKGFPFNMFHTFLEGKNGVHFKKHRALIPEITTSQYTCLSRYRNARDRCYYNVPLEFYPKELLELVASSICDGQEEIYQSHLTRYIRERIRLYPREVFISTVEIVAEGWQNRSRVANIAMFYGQPVRSLFRDGPILELLKKTQFYHAMCNHYLPTMDTILQRCFDTLIPSYEYIVKEKWEAALSVPSE